MIYGTVLVIHSLVALFLIGVILVQGGRGGLGEALGGAAAQSLFGGGANIVMTKVTAVAATLFMVTCLSLAALSTARGKSVIDKIPFTSEGLPFGLPGTVSDVVPDVSPITTVISEEEGAPSADVARPPEPVPPSDITSPSETPAPDTAPAEAIP